MRVRDRTIFFIFFVLLTHQYQQLVLSALYTRDRQHSALIEATGREWWVLHRSTHWWLEIVNEAWVDDYDDARLNREYIKAFPVDKHTFSVIVDLLRPHVDKKDTKFRKARPVELRVAIALYK